MDRHSDDRLDAANDDMTGERYDPVTNDTEHEGHATTGGAALAGAATGGAIGLAGGPVGAAVGAVGGAIVGAIAERVMHSDDDSARSDAGLDNDRDGNPVFENRTDANMGAATMDTPRRTGEGSTIELREEELTARKEMREAGAVEVRKEVVEEHRTIDVPVTREEAVIERRPVNREVTDANFRPEGEEVRVQLREEEVTAEKRPVVTEEIHVGKRTVQDTETVTGTVRREEAVVEREGDTRIGTETGRMSTGSGTGMGTTSGMNTGAGSTGMGTGTGTHSHSFVTGDTCDCGERRPVV